MKTVSTTAFALALLAYGAEATISNVEAVWLSKKHIEDNSLMVCGKHSVAVTSGASNTITYKYAGATCKNEGIKWGTAQSFGGAGGSIKLTCSVDDTQKEVTCHTIQVTAPHYSCVTMTKCRPTAHKIENNAVAVKQSQTDSTYTTVSVGEPFASNPLTALAVTKPTASESKVGAAEFVMEFAITPAANIETSRTVTVLAPGYSQLTGGTCQFGSDAESTAVSATQINAWSFTPGAQASGGGATTLKCTKVKVSETAAKAAGQFAVMYGASLTSVDEMKFVASPEITSETTTTTTTTATPKTASAATASLSAAALLLAASLYL